MPPCKDTSQALFHFFSYPPKPWAGIQISDSVDWHLPLQTQLWGLFGLWDRYSPSSRQVWNMLAHQPRVKNKKILSKGKIKRKTSWTSYLRSPAEVMFFILMTVRHKVQPVSSLVFPKDPQVFPPTPTLDPSGHYQPSVLFKSEVLGGISHRAESDNTPGSKWWPREDTRS